MKSNKTDKREKNFLWIIYIIIFAIFSLFAALDGIQVHVKHLNWAISLAVCVALVILAVINRAILVKMLGNRATLYILIAIGIILRIAYYIIVNPVQVSDFAQADKFWNHLQVIGGYSNYTIKLAEMDDFQKYYSLYPAWGYFMLLMHGMYRLFWPSAIPMIALNMVVDFGVMIVLHRMISKFQSRTLATACVAVFSLWPQCVIWASVTSPDHIIIFFLLITIWMYFEYLKHRDNFKKAFKYILLFSLFLTIAGTFKPISSLIIVAFICAEILISVNGRKIGIKKSAGYCAVAVLSIFVISTLSGSILKSALSNYIHTDVQQATGYYILWAYSVDENGVWNGNYAAEYIEECESSETIAIGLEKVNRSAIEVVKRNFKLIPRIWLRKFYLLFYSENWPLLWTTYNEDGSVKENFTSVLEFWTGVWTLLNSIMMLLMPLALSDRNPKAVFLSLCWMGYMMYLLVGAGPQTRYRVIVIVVQIILGVMGVNTLSKIKWGHLRFQK